MKTLFQNFTIVTMNEQLDVLTNAHLITEDGKILEVAAGPAAEDFDEVIDGQNKQVLMPGLINTHCHAPMTLMRGFAGGHDLQTWLNDYIFPTEDKLTSQSIRAGTTLAAAEMIANGITTFADMYYFCDDMCDVILKSGMNMNICRGITLFTTLDDPADYVPCQEAIALAEQWHGVNNGQILVDLCIHGEYTSFLSTAMWEYLSEYTRAHQLGMHVHVSETRAEHEECKARHNGLTPIQVLDAHGVWSGTRGMAAHCVWVEPEDRKLMAKRGVSVLHCPTSNLKLGSGIAPIPALMADGVNITLGTDGASSNNNLDLFNEIKLTAILHKGANQDATMLPAAEVLKMATVNGAKALGRSSTGMLAAGYDADIIALDFDRPHLKPCHDVMENLVYSARCSDVVLNMTHGKILYRNGFFSTIDVDRMNHELELALPTLFGS